MTAATRVAFAAPDQRIDLGAHDETTDLQVGLSAYRVWGTLGWHDIRQRYRRSVLGPFWVTLSTAILVITLGALYSALMQQSMEDYVPYLGVGLVVWAYIAAVLNDGSTLFVGKAHLIRQIRLPLTVHVARMVWTNFIIMLHSLPVVLVLLIVFGRPPGIEILLLPFALALLFLHGIWFAIVLGVLGARFRDIPPIVQSLVTVAFFFTPVMWMPEILQDRSWVAAYNPFYHMIEIVRAPMVGRPVMLVSWLWTGGFLLLGFATALYLLRRGRNRVPYWV